MQFYVTEQNEDIIKSAISCRNNPFLSLNAEDGSAFGENSFILMKQQEIMIEEERDALRGNDPLENPQETVLGFDDSETVARDDSSSEESADCINNICLLVEGDSFSEELLSTRTKADRKILVSEDFQNRLNKNESHEGFMEKDNLSHTVGSNSTSCTYGSIASVFDDNEMTIINVPQEQSMNFLEIMFGKYKGILDTHPLSTTILTGAILAAIGDGIAQCCKEDPYSFRRGVSFALFDASYRGLQHFVFPKIVETFRGQYLLSPFLAFSLLPRVHETTIHYFASMEQALVNQVLIVPIIYLPAFFSLTGAVQGLTLQGSIVRAKENFIPITLRTWLFWIPAQFVQFCFLQENLQIPFLCLYNLFWTIILSLLAGSIEKYAATDQPYCLTGMEENCSLPAVQLAQQLMLKLR